MKQNSRPRHMARALWPLLLLIVAAACNETYPNSTFQPTTEFNRDLTDIWNVMMTWGTVVFVIVEVILLIAIIKYRRRPDSPEPKHVHGNTLMEITWTVLPMVILALIAVPTVRSIWKYQVGAPANSLKVQVIGHQWWWEFRYPEYNVTTANEVYMIAGRPVEFELRTADVLHSFWMPALGGKRDLISNRTNHLWFTPDSTGENAFIGSCNEFCGASHANMRFRAFVVAPENFESWAKHQAANAVFPPPAPAAVAIPAANTGAQAAPPIADPVAPSVGYNFPADKLGAHIVPATPIPAGVAISDAVIAAGDAQRGFQTYSRSACIGCHKIRGNPSSIGVIGPDLTHVASRHTIAGGIFQNSPKHMAHWIKNARLMKPGSLMQTLGKGERDPIMKMTVNAGGLTDEQIADIVAYLGTLK